MKNLLRTFSVVVALILAFPTIVRGSPAVGAFEAMVVVHIDHFDDAALARLAKVVGTDKNVSLEYSCVWSGIVVLKFMNATVGERADVITLARRQLNAAGIEQGVEFLHVHAEERGPGKC